MKKIKAFFDNGRSKKEEEKERGDSDYAAAVSKLPKLETLAVNMNIIDSLPLPGSKVCVFLCCTYFIYSIRVCLCFCLNIFIAANKSFIFLFFLQ